MRERYGASGLTIIGVNVDAERGDADRFLREVPIDFEIVFDPDGALAKQFKFRSCPRLSSSIAAARSSKPTWDFATRKRTSTKLHSRIC